MEIPLWAAVLFAVALGLPAGKPRWLVALFALALFASVLPATVRWARQSRLFAARRADLQPVDEGSGSARRASALPQLTAEPAFAPRVTQFRAARRDRHVRNEDAPERPGIDAQRPNSMPRADDDAITYARSPEFHDRPGSGKHTADRHDVF